MADVYVGALCSPNYLEHHGILGMKWGVRRFENKDGSLTPAGKKRYSKKRERELKKDIKNRSTLSEKELDTKINRLRKENEFVRLANENLGAGKGEVHRVLKESGKQVLGRVATGVAIYAVHRALSRNTKLTEVADYVAPKPKSKKKD